MVTVIIYRIIRKAVVLRKLRRYRGFYVLLFFIIMWIISSLLFYYSERIVAGRRDIDIWVSMYWSLITMSTIGYGDVTPVKGLGWIVAGFTAIMGIIAYTLTVSIVADWFLSKSIRRSMGLAPLKNKDILVIGDSDTCYEVIDELVSNNYGDHVGWITPEKPRSEPPVEYMIGDPRDPYTVEKTDIEKARYIILCFREDSVTLHTVLFLRKYNKKAVYAAIVSSSSMEELLREAGVNYVLSQKVLGRAIASAVFEPSVLQLLSDIVSIHGEGDLVEHVIGGKDSGKTIGEYEKYINNIDQTYKYRVLGIYRGGKLELLPDNNTVLEKDDKIILLRAVRK